MSAPALWAEAEAHIANADPKMGDVVKRYGSCTITPDDNIFIGLLEAIVSQQLSIKASATIFGRLQALHPDGLTPQAVLETPMETLRACGFSRAKAGYVHDLSQHVLDGRLELDRLDQMTDEDVITELTAVKGIGRWTAEMILIFHLCRPDVLPVDDLGIREGFKRVYDLEERPESDEMNRLADPWRPWRSIGSWYLWRTLENQPMTSSV